MEELRGKVYVTIKWSTQHNSWIIEVSDEVFTSCFTTPFEPTVMVVNDEEKPGEVVLGAAI